MTIRKLMGKTFINPEKFFINIRILRFKDPYERNKR